MDGVETQVFIYKQTEFLYVRKGNVVKITKGDDCIKFLFFFKK